MNINQQFCTQAAAGLKPKYLEFKNTIFPLKGGGETSKPDLDVMAQQLAMMMVEIYLVYREGGLENALVTTLMLGDTENRSINPIDLPLTFSSDGPVIQLMINESTRRGLPIALEEFSTFGQLVEEYLKVEGNEELLVAAATH